MRKFFKKRSKKILSIFLLLPFIAQTFITPLLALDEILPEIQVEEDISETQVDIPIDTSEDILEEGISDPEEIAKPIWVTSEESATTFSPVVLGEKYVYPHNSDVTVVFSSLPEVSGTLTIKTVYLTDEQVKATNAASNVAFDITTDMVDGTFNYDLTLPKVGESNTVVYAESVNELVDAKDISNVIENESSLKIEDLDHFTVFVVTTPNPVNTDCSSSGLTVNNGDKCYNTIQAAINAASSGDTIKVMAGTYSENININRSVVLEGVDGTIINPANGSQPIVTISTSGVSIKNIDIVGTGSNSHGISILGGGSNTILTSVSSTYNGGNGIEVSISGTLNDIELNNCNLSYNNIGFRTGSSSGIKGLKLTNTNADYNKTAGLYFNGPITGLNLNGGSYSHNRGSSNTTSGLGIYAVRFNDFHDTEKGTMLLTNFVANDNVRGVIIDKFYGPFSITNAVISYNLEEGLAVAPGTSVSNLLFEDIKANNNPKWNFWLISYLGYTVSNVVIKDSEFNGSTGTTGYEGTGLYLYASTNSTLSNVSVTNTSMNGNRVGLYMRTVSATSIGNIVVKDSSLAGNSEYGAFNNDSTRSIDLRSNWWGHDSGPFVASSNTTGKGSKIAGPVEFFPWYTDSSRTVLVTSLTQFVGSASYVRAENSGDGSADVKVPEPTEEVRFILNGDTNNPVAGYFHQQSGNSPLNGFEHWRLKTSLPAGQYTLTAQYRVGSTWYDVVGSNLAYSIDEPWAEWVSPLPEQYFRPSDNPLRIKADDQYFQFQKVVFNINGTDYTVERSSCDLRSAGSYVLCDVKSVSNWAGLAEGTYRTYSPSFTSALVKVQTYTFAQNRFDPNEFTESNSKTASRVFYIDGTIPTTSNFTIDNASQYFSKSITASVNASDDNGLLHDVTFFITEPRSTDGVCDGNGIAIVSQSITSPDSDGKYRASLDTSSLNGSYCVNAQAEDASNSHSLPIERQKVVIDNKGPEAPIITSPIAESYFNATPILNDWTEVTDSSGIAYYRIEYVYDDNHIFPDAPYRKTSDGTTTQRNHIPNISEQGGVTIRVQAVDNAGNESEWSDPVHYIYDETDPTVPTNGTPNNSILSTNNFDFIWTASTDASAITYEFQSSMNPAQSGGVLTTGLWKSGTLSSNMIHSSGAQDGIWYWQVRAKDAAGNYSNWSEIWTVTLDTQAPSKPVITNTIEFTNENNITINWTDGDDQATNATGVKGYLFRYVFTPANGGNNVDWPSGLVLVGNSKTRTGIFGHGEGKYVMYVQTVDMAGNLSPESDPYTITYDKTKPSIEILGPVENSSHSGSFNIQVKGADTSSGLKQFVANIKDSQGNNIGTCVNENENGALDHTVTCTINTASYANGQYSIKTNVTDRAGNMSQTLSRSFIFDNANPNGDILGIRYTKGDIQNFITNDNTPIIYGTCIDNNGVSKVEVEINNNTQTLTCDNGNWVSSEFLPLDDGEYNITLTITDLAGNTLTDSQILTIDTKAPKGTYTYYRNGTPITDTIAYVKGVDELSFTAVYSDDTPSSGILKDSYVIFDSNEAGTARTSVAYCGWRDPANTLMITENPIPFTSAVPFINCELSLDDGGYFMYHQVYDNATMKNNPDITQFRDVKGLHFVVDSVAPTSDIDIQADLNETPNLAHNNGWHGKGWYYHFDKITLSVDNPESGNFIQYQILDGESSTPGETWTKANDGIDLSETINAKADGIYTIFWYAEDLAGNTETTQREVVKIDRTSPTYTIDFNSINGIADGNITYIPEDEIRVAVKVADILSGYTRARYDLYTADENWNCTFDSFKQDDLVPAVDNTTRTLTVKNLSDGRYCLKIWVYDDVQNKSYIDTNGEQWVHFIIDTKLPDTPSGLHRRALDGTTYSCGAYAQLQTLIPDWNDSSDINFDYFEYTSFNADGSIGLNEEPLLNSEFVHNWIPTVEGTYGYAVRAVDKAGNKSDWALTGKTLADSCQITYDSTPPVIETLTQYTYNLSEGEAIPDVQTEVTDETGLKKAYYTLTNVDLGTFNDDMDLSGTSKVVDITGLIKTYAKDYFGEDITTIDTYYIPEGVYTIEYYVEDIAGNISSTETIIINITNVVPIVDSFTADVLSITEGDTVNFEAIFSDPSYIEYVSGEKHADDAEWTYAFNPEGTYEPEFTTNILGETLSFSHTYNNEGTYIAEIKVCEDSLNKGEGKCTTETVEIVVSNNIPTLTITPATSEVAQGTQAVVLSANVTSGNTPYTYLWSGSCTGDTPTTTVSTATEGTFTCNLQVTDADGDITTSQATVTVGAVAGATTSTKTTKPSVKASVLAYSDGTGNGDEEENTTDETVMEVETTEEVLGETTCEATYKISGTIYYDKNDNGKYDEEEEIVEGIEVNIYNSDKELEKTVTTDEKGHWEATLCPGEYTTQVERAEDQTIVLGESDTTLDISVEKKTNWWLIVVGGVVVLILLKVLIDRSKKKEEI